MGPASALLGHREELNARVCVVSVAGENVSSVGGECLGWSMQIASLSPVVLPTNSCPSICREAPDGFETLLLRFLQLIDSWNIRPSIKEPAGSSAASLERTQEA